MNHSFNSYEPEQESMLEELRTKPPKAIKSEDIERMMSEYKGPITKLPIAASSPLALSAWNTRPTWLNRNLPGGRKPALGSFEQWEE